METALKKQTDRFAENFERLNTLFFEDKSPLTRVGAFLLTMTGKAAPTELLVSCKRLSETSIGAFGAGSAQLLPFVTAATAVFASADQLLSRPARAYRALKEAFLPSPYLIPAAYTLAWLRTDDTLYDNIADSCRRLYDLESGKHPLATGYEDICGILLLSMSGEPHDVIIQRLKTFDALITPSFGTKNATQSLKFTLALYPEEETAAKSVLLCDLLRQKGMRLANDSLAGLGALCGMTESSLVIAERIFAVSEDLKTKDGFGLFGVGTKERRFWALLLTALDSVSAGGGLPARNALLSALLAFTCANTSDSAPVFHPETE